MEVGFPWKRGWTLNTFSSAYIHCTENPLLAGSLGRTAVSIKTSAMCFRQRNSLRALSTLTPLKPSTSHLQIPALPLTGFGVHTFRILLPAMNVRNLLGRLDFYSPGVRQPGHSSVWRVHHFLILESACNMLTIHFPPKDTAFVFCQSFPFLLRLPTEVPIIRLVCHTDNCPLGINFLQQAPDFHFYSNNNENTL